MVHVRTSPSHSVVVTSTTTNRTAAGTTRSSPPREPKLAKSRANGGGSRSDMPARSASERVTETMLSARAARLCARPAASFSRAAAAPLGEYFVRSAPLRRAADSRLLGSFAGSCVVCCSRYCLGVAVGLRRRPPARRRTTSPRLSVSAPNWRKRKHVVDARAGVRRAPRLRLAEKHVCSDAHAAGVRRARASGSSLEFGKFLSTCAAAWCKSSCSIASSGTGKHVRAASAPPSQMRGARVRRRPPPPIARYHRRPGRSSTRGPTRTTTTTRHRPPPRRSRRERPHARAHDGRRRRRRRRTTSCRRLSCSGWRRTSARTSGCATRRG